MYIYNMINLFKYLNNASLLILIIIIIILFYIYYTKNSREIIIKLNNL